MALHKRLVTTFYQNNKHEYRLKLIKRGGNPQVGIASLDLKKGKWRTGKKQFYMSIEEWNCFMAKIAYFNDDAQRGNLVFEYLLG